MELSLLKFVVVVHVCMFERAMSIYIPSRSLNINSWFPPRQGLAIGEEKSIMELANDDEETMMQSSGSGPGTGTHPVCRPCECQCQCDYPAGQAEADRKGKLHA